MGLRTEFSFTLPKGYVDRDGALHRHGTMRLSTARDEIEPLRDQRISSAEDPYLTIIVLARVITELGSLSTIDTSVVEGLFAADLAFLQDVYGIINFGDAAELAVLQEAVLAADAGSDFDFDEEREVEIVHHDTLEIVETPTVVAAVAAAPAAPAVAAHALAHSPAAPAGNVFTDDQLASLRRRAIEEVRSDIR